MTNNQNKLVEAHINNFFKITRFLKKQGSSFLENDLSPLQMFTLIFIKENKNPTISDISSNFKVALPTATKLLDRLSKLKFVKRVHDPKDRRIIRMELTKLGDETLIRMREQRTKHFKEIFKLIPQKDLETLNRIFNKLLNKLEEKYGQEI